MTPGLLHHGLGQQDRVAHPLHAGHRTCSLGGAVHHRGIQFVVAVMGEHRALAGVEGRIVLQHGDCRSDGCKRRATGRQFGMALQQRRAQRVARSLLLSRRQVLALDARTAVDDQQRRGGRGGLGKQRQGQQRGQHQAQFHQGRLQKV